MNQRVVDATATETDSIHEIITHVVIPRKTIKGQGTRTGFNLGFCLFWFDPSLDRQNWSKNLVLHHRAVISWRLNQRRRKVEGVLVALATRQYVCPVDVTLQPGKMVGVDDAAVVRTL
jgi:hypothetical protein